MAHYAPLSPRCERCRVRSATFLLYTFQNQPSGTFCGRCIQQQCDRLQAQEIRSGVVFPAREAIAQQPAPPVTDEDDAAEQAALVHVREYLRHTPTTRSRGATSGTQ